MYPVRYQLGQKTQVRVLTTRFIIPPYWELNRKNNLVSFTIQLLAFDDWESKQLKELTYPVDQKLNRRYLLHQDDPSDTLPPAKAQLICVKSPKGTGKTHWMAWFTSPLLSSGEKRILLLTHRIQLSTQDADRLCIPYVTERQRTAKPKIYKVWRFVSIPYTPILKQSLILNIGVIAYVILDEVMQVIWHLLSSTTCVKERVTIIKTLKATATECYSEWR